MATGMTPEDSQFMTEWTALLREVGAALSLRTKTELR